MVEQKQNLSSDEMSQPKINLYEGHDEMCAIAGGVPLPFSVCTTRAFLIAAKVVNTPQEASRLAVLEYSVRRGDIGVLKKLLKEGADPNTDFNDHTLLDIALTSTSSKIRDELVRELLRAGADPNKRSWERSPLTIAIESGSPVVTKLLLDAGADFSQAQQSGITLLRTVIGCENTEEKRLKMVKLLLDKGVDVNETSDLQADPKTVKQITALMAAASHGQVKVVKLLLKAGADPKMLDSNGKSAADYAAGFGIWLPWNATEVIKILTAAGAPPAVLSGPLALPPPPPDFHKAARSENFRKALKELTSITGVKPRSLESIPGGKVFEIRALSDERPKALAAELHEKMLALGCYVCYSYDIEAGAMGNCIVAVPSTDVYEVIAAFGTHGGDSNCDTDKIIEWLRKLEKYQPFVMTSIGPDFLEGKFTTPITNPMALAERIDGFCHDIVSQGTGTVSKLADELRKSPRMYLWWD